MHFDRRRIKVRLFFDGAKIPLYFFGKFPCHVVEKLLCMPDKNGAKNSFRLVLIDSTLAMKINAKLRICSLDKTNTTPHMHSNRNQINFQG